MNSNNMTPSNMAPSSMAPSAFVSEADIKRARRKCFQKRRGEFKVAMTALAVLLIWETPLLTVFGGMGVFLSPDADMMLRCVYGGIAALGLLFAVFAAGWAYSYATLEFDHIGAAGVVEGGCLMYVWWPKKYNNNHSNQQSLVPANVAVAELERCHASYDGCILTISGAGLYTERVRGWSCYDPAASGSLVAYVRGGGALSPARKPLTIAYPVAEELAEQIAPLCGQWADARWRF